MALLPPLPPRGRDQVHQLDALADMEEAFLAQEERIRDLEMEASRQEALPEIR